jgi:hypothetical protein
MGKVKDQFYQEAWNIYHLHQDAIKNGAKSNVIPTREIGVLCERLHDNLKKIPQKAENISILDIGLFISEASEYIEGHNGWQARILGL